MIASAKISFQVTRIADRERGSLRSSSEPLS